MKKQNIIIIGMAATGKTTIGKLLAEVLHKEFIDLDRKIESRCGVDIETIFAIEGEDGFRMRETNELERVLKDSDGYILSLGGGTVTREQNRKLIQSTANYLVIQLYTDDLSLLVERITQSANKRPLLSSGDIATKVTKLYEERKECYDLMTDIKVEIANARPIQTVNYIVNELKNY